jgi:tetratricopeptide (TPR) repeat protein
VQRIDAAWAPASAQRATVRQALAAGLDAAGRREEAAEVLEQAREIALATYGPEAMTLAIIDTNLGIARARLGKFDEAERHLNRALAAVQTTFGVGHQQTWFPTEGLAQLARERGDKARAAELYETCAKILARGEGVFARERFRCRTNAAQVRWLLGEHATAEREFRQLLEIGPPHASELSDLELGLGLALRGLGRHREAVPHLERALEVGGGELDDEKRAWIETELTAARRNAD